MKTIHERERKLELYQLRFLYFTKLKKVIRVVNLIFQIKVNII